MPVQSHQAESARVTGSVTHAESVVSDEMLVLRNYDGEATHDIAMRLLDEADEVAFERTYTVDPGSTITVAARLDRAVYVVDARLEAGPTASATCLIGSGPDEAALIEAGNGILSVSERSF
jgi:hypothetical protein